MRSRSLRHKHTTSNVLVSEPAQPPTPRLATVTPANKKMTGRNRVHSGNPVAPYIYIYAFFFFSFLKLQPCPYFLNISLFPSSFIRSLSSGLSSLYCVSGAGGLVLSSLQYCDPASLSLLYRVLCPYAHVSEPLCSACYSILRCERLTQNPE